MAHFAKVIDNIVTDVIVADGEFFNNFIDDSPGEWLQTSYNTRGGVHYDPETGIPDDKTPLRKNYASPGYSYNPKLDAFIPPQTFPSWILNEESCLWEAPIPYPQDGEFYSWNEEDQTWDLVDSE